MIVEPRRRVFRSGLAIALALPAVAGGAAAFAQSGSAYFLPGNLVLSRVVYDNNPSNVVADATQLPPGCAPDACATAIADGTYPYVFSNDTVDGSFGIASKIILDQLTPSGAPVNSLEVPNSAQNGVPPTKDQMVGSFSSKSEVALNLSTSGSYLTFMGYLAPIDAIDVSNSNTPAVLDPTNPVPGQNFRVVAQVDGHGKFHFTQTNAYSGNNGRAAILNDKQRCRRDLYGRECRQRRQPATRRDHHRRRGADHDPRGQGDGGAKTRAYRRRSAALISRSCPAPARTRSAKIPIFAG